MKRYIFFVLSSPNEMSEDGEARFREPKTVYEERELVEKAILSSTKYRSKSAVTICSKWQIFCWVIASVLVPGGLFKGYDLQRTYSFLPALKKWMQ